MKIRLVTLVLSLGTLLAFSARAGLEWETKEVELAPKLSDKTTVARFKYKNTGDKPVRITSVHASCGCTTAKLEKEVVAPNESGEIAATFHIGDRSGRQTKTITVKTDEQPEQPTVLKLKATIPQLLQVSPTFVFWSAKDVLDPKTINVGVSPEYPVKDLKVTATDKTVETEVVRDPENKSFRIVVRPTEGGRPINATLKIEPDFPKDTPKAYYATLRIDGRATMPAP